MPKTDFFENEVLKLSLGKATTLTYPITPYLGLVLTLPNEDGTGMVEVSGAGYQRQAISSAFPTPSGTGVVANTSVINFGTPSGDWGVVKGIIIATAQSGGQILRYAELPTLLNAVSGSPVSIPVGMGIIEEQ